MRTKSARKKEVYFLVPFLVNSLFIKAGVCWDLLVVLGIPFPAGVGGARWKARA